MSILTGYSYVRRVLLATIRDKGSCACPRCLIPKSRFHCTGLLRDLAARFSQARTYLVDKIKLAWQAIYVLGRPLKGTTAESLLKDKSLVPTLVRLLLVSDCYLTTPLRTLFVSNYHLWDSTCTQFWWSIFCMSSSWEFSSLF